ncbi:MAG: biotin synthase BioB [Planctomycetes bacterium]|nr:biotin synthase BioB [Planctomycetota bacterium]
MTQDPSLERAHALLARPLLELVFEAAVVHREHHDPRAMQCSQLLSIKTGACPEDCGYCSQSARFATPTTPEKLLEHDVIVDAARAAKDGGADRFCMGAAWREVKDGAQFDRVLEAVREVKGLGLETCVTLGMLDAGQARRLREAGLDYYNHNLDTGRSHYANVITTRTYDDRLATIANVRDAGIHVCCGGIVGLGEDRAVRAELLAELAAIQPDSVPINHLVPVEGTPLEDAEPLDWTEVVRTVAVARILLPNTVIRLSAGRAELGEAVQAMCFLAGANSIFVGDELLTTPNPAPDSDARLLDKLGLEPLANACPSTPS